MSNTETSNVLPKDFLLLENWLDEPKFSKPDDEHRPNRMCICFSDVHFTDGTVGNQSGEAVVWENVFDRIKDLCVRHEIRELYLVLAGDVADMIRTAQWAKHGVYPWDRTDPKFEFVLREIMQGIIDQHNKGPGPCEPAGFFYWLKRLKIDLENYRAKDKGSQVAKIQTLVLLGNHDKEIFADDESLKLFYEACLGQPVAKLPADYRRWIGEMYFGDKNRYDDPASVPWLPFYWGDKGFRLFLTHGQWRDEDNSRRIDSDSASGRPGWQVSDGWNLDTWRKLQYAPFTEPCFGDTVAAGVLSGFIYRASEKLEKLPAKTDDEKKEIARLVRILGELDLYRPTYAAVGRIIVETWRLRQAGAGGAAARNIIEQELRDSVRQWLSWDFTYQSARPVLRLGLKFAKLVLTVMKLLGARIELVFIYLVMRGMAKLKQGLFRTGDAPSYSEMLAFPGFLPQYREYGFRIHGEGHTHIPLQEELYFKEPEQPSEHKSYTYINFGAWRDSIVTAMKRKYRRRGVGRALCVLDLLPDPACAEEEHRDDRRFAYWVEDILTWSDNMDRL